MSNIQLTSTYSIVELVRFITDSSFKDLASGSHDESVDSEKHLSQAFWGISWYPPYFETKNYSELCELLFCPELFGAKTLSQTYPGHKHPTPLLSHNL